MHHTRSLLRNFFVILRALARNGNGIGNGSGNLQCTLTDICGCRRFVDRRACPSDDIRVTAGPRTQLTNLGYATATLRAARCAQSR